MRDQTSQHNRPGVGHIIAIGLGYFIAVAAILIAVGLTIDDAYRNMDNSIIIGIDAIAATAAGVAIQMHCSYLAQVRVLDGQAAIIKLINLRSSELAADTGQIPRLAMAVVDAPEVVYIRDSEPRFDQEPRSVLLQLIQSAEEAKAAAPDRQVYWDAYTDALTDLAGIGSAEGEPPQTQ